jgi:spore germination protein
MKDAKKYGLTDFQLLAIVISTILGAGIITMSRTLGAIAGRDAWISTALAGIAVWLLSGLIYLLCRRFPEKTLPEFSSTILGRPLGILVSILYAVYALFLGATALRIFHEMIKTWLMVRTPLPVFVMLIVVPTVYAARMGAVTLGRLMELIMYITVIALLVFLIPVGDFIPLNVLPVGAEGLTAIASAMPKAAFAFLGFEVLLVFFPFVVNRDRVFRVYTLALAVVTLLYMGIIVITYGVLTFEHTLKKVWPLMNYLRVGTLPILERVDNMMMFLWLAQIFAVVAIQYYASTYTMATLVGRSRHDLWALLAWPLVYIVAVFPNRQEQVFQLGDLVGMSGMIFLLILVVLLLLVAMARGLDEGKKGERADA